MIERAEENGGRIAFRNYASLEETFARKVGLSSKHLLFNISYEFCLEENFMLVDITCIAAFFVGSPHQELHPLDLKMGVTAFLNEVCIYSFPLRGY